MVVMVAILLTASLRAVGIWRHVESVTMRSLTGARQPLRDRSAMRSVMRNMAVVSVSTVQIAID